MDSMKKENFKTNDAYVFHVLLRYLHVRMFSYFNRYENLDVGTLWTLFQLPMLEVFQYLRSEQKTVTDKPFQAFLTRTLDQIEREKHNQRITFSVEQFQKMANRVQLDQDDLFQHVMVAYAPASSGYKSRPTQYYFSPNPLGLPNTPLTRDTLLLTNLFSGGKPIVMRVEETDGILPNYWQWVYSFTRYYLDHMRDVPLSDLLSHVFDVIARNALPLSPIDVSNIMRESLYNKKTFSMPLPNLLAVVKTNYHVFWQEGISFHADVPPYLKEPYIFNVQDLCHTFYDPFFFDYLSFIEKTTSVNFRADVSVKEGANIYQNLYGPLLHLLLNKAKNSTERKKQSRHQKNITHMGKSSPDDMRLAGVGMSLEARGASFDTGAKTSKTNKNADEDDDDEKTASDDDDASGSSPSEDETQDTDKSSSKITSNAKNGEKPTLFENDDDAETPDNASDDNKNKPSDQDDGDNTIGKDDADAASSDDDASGGNASKMTLVDMDKREDVDNAFLYRQAVQSMCRSLLMQTDEEDRTIPPEDLDKLRLWCNQWLWLASISATRDLVSELGLRKILDKSLKLQ